MLFNGLIWSSRHIWTNPGPFQTALVENHIFWFLRVMLDQLFLKNSISYGSWDHSDTRKRLGDESSSLDLRTEKCDLTSVFVVESHFLLEYDFAISRHADMILSWLKRRNMICIFWKQRALILSWYWTVSGSTYLRPGLAVSGTKYLRLAVSG